MSFTSFTHVLVINLYSLSGVLIDELREEIGDDILFAIKC
jgi:hypothetical protein